jgi:vacuolar-type H+-ATPase subunit I/STV1
MAIERIKKVTIVSPKRADRQLLKTINRLGVMHVTDLGETLPENTVLQYHKASTADADENLRKIDFILNFMNIFCPEQQSFAQGLTPLPVVTTPDELNVILKQYDLDEQHHKTNELDEIYRQAERVISEIESELRDLEPLADLPFVIGDFFRPERTCLLFGYLPAKKVPLLDPNIEYLSVYATALPSLYRPNTRARHRRRALHLSGADPRRQARPSYFRPSSRPMRS